MNKSDLPARAPHRTARDKLVATAAGGGTGRDIGLPAWNATLHDLDRAAGMFSWDPT